MDTNVRDSIQRLSDGNTPSHQETPYQKRLKRRSHFSGQKHTENGSGSTSSNTPKKNVYKGRNKSVRITKQCYSPCSSSDTNVTTDVEYSEVDTDHEWRIKDHKDYMVVDCREDINREYYQGEKSREMSVNVEAGYEQLVDGINDVHLSNSGSHGDHRNGSSHRR